MVIVGAALGLLCGCGGGRLPQSFSLTEDVTSAVAAGLSFPRAPEPVDIEVAHERRPVVLTTTEPWEWRGRVPAAATLHAGVQLLPQAWRVIRGLQAWVTVRSGDEREILDVVRTAEWQNPNWLDFTVDLSRYAGREVALQFSAALQGLPAEHRRSNLVAWGPVVLSSREAEREERPNVLFILVDTLRRDHMTPYGYHRDTTPEISRWLATPGTVLEDAYSQAPWTLPSVVSFLTGRSPGEMLGADLSTYGIPEKVPTLAERLAALDYQTGGFIANPALHAGAGFERGFQTFYAPPADLEWMRHHADELTARARPWLEAHQRQPFFLYVHYIDPHDPYENPDIVDNRSPFETGYGGPVTGEWIHGIYNGRVPLQDLRRDLFHIEALYDSEIRYVDRYIGELLSTLEPEVLGRTLVVLTADHGEELYDHGGWKHGQTLYDEQIRVPLIFRWDGRIAAGRRLAGTVRLLDLMPTLVSAAGGKTDPAWQGIDLLPALTGERPLPRRPAFAQHLSGGPLRAAAVLGRQKLILFNPEEAFQPADGLQAYLWRKDLARLQRVELYDLARDAGERDNLAQRHPERVRGLEPAIHHRLDAQLPGLRVFLAGLPSGSRLSGTLVFERAPERWVPYFLAAGDQAQLIGTRLELRADGGGDRQGTPGRGGLRPDPFGGGEPRRPAAAARADPRRVRPAPWRRAGKPWGSPLSCLARAASRRCPAALAPLRSCAEPQDGVQPRNRAAPARSGVRAMNEALQPPGWAERVRAGSALVLAPHYDDEILGCGGLLAQLAAAGAAVRVLFLSDGGEEGGRRREEAVRVSQLLGLAGCDHLGLPDGALDRRLEEAAQGIRRALLSQRPELLLAPSPLEVSRDHRAAFAALHRLLSPLREGDPDQELLGGLRILLYEINHPGHPDLLVDVTAEEPLLAKAMAVYASQEERHPYWNASQGLRRFRTLTLGPGTGLAEGYRRLRVDDFTTRSHAQLVRHLGGLPELHEAREGPRISVVVRTRDRPDLLAEALASLAQGEYRRAEVVLVNDGGAPPAVPEDYPLPVVRIDLDANRGRAAAAEAGIAAATGDYVAFLDDDDLAAPEHLATLAGLVSAAGVRVAYTDAAVAVYELDAGGWTCRERRLPYSRDFDADVLLVDNYIPFNTLLIERRLFAEAGPFDPSLPFFEDWDFLIRLSAVTAFHHLARVTCEYRHFRGGGHHVFGERPRERADFLEVKARILAKHAPRLLPETLARAVDTLRSELVAEREGGAGARRDLERLRSDLATLAGEHQALARERFLWEERYHAANGEIAALRGDLERFKEDRGRVEAEVQRLFEEERKLRAAVGDQTAHLGRTYAEIERLNKMIRDMESTRAWRIHQWWGRRRS